MAFQTAANVLVAIKRETTFATAPATVTGAIQMRYISSNGLKLDRAQVQSAEKRVDGLKNLGRLGYKTVSGDYTSELTSGGHHDSLVEAIMRSTWTPALPIAFASVTTVAISTNQLTCGAGSSWVTAGVKVGDIFTLASTTVSGDNGLNTRVLSVSTGTIVVPNGTFTTLSAAATGTLTILKKVKTAATPTRYSYAVEQYDTDVDLTELFLGCRVVGMKLSMKPGQNVTVQYTFAGADRTALTTGTSPFYTSPSLTTGLAMLADDSSIRRNGAAMNSTAATPFTGFDLDFAITNKAVPIIGSLVTPNIFDNDLVVSGTITGLRSDFSDLTLFDAETEYEISALFQEANSGTPLNAFAFYLPRTKLSTLSAPVGGGDGEKAVTLGVWTGPKTATTVDDAGIAVFHSSAP